MKLPNNLPTPHATIPRNSSVELFRIIATLSVLIVHFNGWFVGGLPDSLDFRIINWRWCQFFISGATCVCVNLFLIISGFFGLKFKISSFVHIGLLLIGIYIPFSIIGGYITWNSISLVGILYCFYNNIFFISKAGYFVQCYLMLIFFSPILNSFVQNNSRRNVLLFVLLFWLIEFWFGCIQNIKDFGFNNGYSIIHFVLIYMMARVVALYKTDLLHIPSYLWWCGYVLCTIILTVMFGVGIRWGYSNPVNIVSAFCLFMPFLYFSFQSKTINGIAKHTFAVYIIQVTNPAYRFLVTIDAHLLNNFDYRIYLVGAAATIIVFFVACILYDWVREIAMSPIEKLIEYKIGKIYRQPLFNNSNARNDE